jgi:hypothetical protein
MAQVNTPNGSVVGARDLKRIKTDCAGKIRERQKQFALKAVRAV